MSAHDTRDGQALSREIHASECSGLVGLGQLGRTVLCICYSLLLACCAVTDQPSPLQIVASVEPQPTSAHGTLVVYTETEEFVDGGISYFPHLPYEIHDDRGEVLRIVDNHIGKNDESPSRVVLPPGTYMVRPRAGRGLAIKVTVAEGRTTRVEVDKYLSAKP